MDAKEQAAAIIQARTSWPQAEGIALDLEMAGMLKAPPTIADLGMFTVDLQQVIDLLRRIQHDACLYRTADGDGQVCDCKFGGDYLSEEAKWSEQTGCPELRQAIRTLEWLDGKR